MVSRATKMILSLALPIACSEEQGDLSVQIYGEEFIETGIPSDVFVDGWAIEFDSFLISVGEVTVAGVGSDPALEETQFKVFDLTTDSGGVGYMVAAGSVPGGSYDQTSYMVASSSDLVAGNASEADVARMKDGGFSVYLAGSATKGDEAKSFAWGFTTRTHYHACESNAVVKATAPASVQLTIHGDHLFLDDLFSETPSVRFDLVAGADVNGDGDITQAELEAVDLRPLQNYQVGSTGITDLWHFIEHLTSTLGHIDGEGHCESERES